MSPSAPTASQAHFTALQSPLKSRSEIVEACKSLLEPLLPFFSPAKTRVRLGATATRYDETGAQLEGYTRPMWGLASLLAGGDNFEGTDYWLEGLRHGTDPEHAEFWGYAKDLDQRMVEMCPLGYALCVAPKRLWDPLTEREKSNVEKWLGWINDKEVSHFATDLIIKMPVLILVHFGGNRCPIPIGKEYIHCLKQTLEPANFL